MLGVLERAVESGSKEADCVFVSKMAEEAYENVLLGPSKRPLPVVGTTVREGFWPQWTKRGLA